MFIRLPLVLGFELFASSKVFLCKLLSFALVANGKPS
jgi:hypothetical protein